MKVTFFPRLALAALFCFSSTAVLAEEPRAKAFAPENHVELKDTVSGSYFIAKPLKEEYDRLLSRLKTLQADIESERTSGAEALRTLKELQTELQRLRAEIEAKKILVPIAKTHQKTESTTFDPGKEKLLVITADSVRLIGWEGPGGQMRAGKDGADRGRQARRGGNEQPQARSQAWPGPRQSRQNPGRN